MSEEQPKKKGRGKDSIAAGDRVTVKIEGVDWPGKHVRFNTGKTFKLPNKKQVACTIVVLLDGQANPISVPYLDVTYLPKPPKEVATEPTEQVNLIQEGQPPEGSYYISKIIDNGVEYTMEQYSERMKHKPWRSVMDVVEENDPTNVYWDNTPQKAYVMVDEDGVVFTYEVEPGIETLADLERLMQLSGWQLGEDVVQPPIEGEDIMGAVDLMADTMRNWDGKDSGISKTAADAKIYDMVWYQEEDKRRFAEIYVVTPLGVWASNAEASKCMVNEGFGTTWGFVSPNFMVAPITTTVESGAAGPTVDAPQGDNAAEEPKTTPVASHMLALRWDTEILGEERLPYRVWGIQFIGGSRYRVIETPGGSIDFAPGPTSVLKAVIPKAQALSDWQVNTFRDTKELAAYMALKTGYGSVVHGAFADALNGVTAAFEDRQWWLEYLKAACARNGAKGMESAWLMDVQKSLMSIRQWAIDYKVRFLFVEKALYAPKLGVCGQIDMLVEMDSHIQNVKSTVKAKREEPTRILALVDIKTGKDSDQYPAQLAMYKQMLVEGFPRIKEIIKERYPSQVVDDGFTTYNIPCLLLFPESGWRKAPKAARMLDRTEKAAEYAATKMHHHIDLFKADRRQPPAKTVLSGPSGFGFTNEGAVGFKTMSDLWMEKIAQGDLEPVEDISEEDEAD